MTLAALVISYNSADHLPACLASCRGRVSDVLVVDNASSDRSPQIALDLGARLLANSENLGFAAAVNQGFEALPHADSILLLNPDIVLTHDPAILLEELKDPRVAAASGLLTHPDGRPQLGFFARRLPTATSLVFENLALNRLLPWNPVNRSYRYLDLDPARPSDIEQPAAACLLIRRAAWASVSGFDEAFAPVWFEDVDFCRRLLAASWRLRFSPHFSAQHAGGHSVLALPTSDRKILWYASLLKYAGKHFSALGRRFVALSVLVGWFARSVTGMLLAPASRPWSNWSFIMRLVASHLGSGPGPVSTAASVRKAAG